MTDNEIARGVLTQAGIEVSDWMIRGSLGFHERCLVEQVALRPILAVPGVEMAIQAVARTGAIQLVLSWETERATSIRLAGARLNVPFEIPKGQPGGGRLRGVFSAEHGNFEGVLQAMTQWANGTPLAVISGSPRELILAARAGAHCIGITSGGSSPLDLSVAGARLVVTERTGLERIDHLLSLDRLGAIARAQTVNGETRIL